LDYPELWEEVKRRGYLQEELEEAIEWLQLCRYVEWDRQRGIIRQAVAELDPNDLKGQLIELRNQVSQLIEAFDETILDEVNQRIDEAETNLDANGDDEVALDQVQRTIQASLERIEGFCSGKRSALQKELERIKLQLESFTRDLNASKVSQPIHNTSGLEPCLNDYRKTLERQVNQLDRDCKNLSSSIANNETDLLALHRQIEQCNQTLKNYESTKKRLQPLVAGLEQWRVIVTRAGALRTNLNNDPKRLMRYEDDFVDRVVSHFSNHQIDSFKQYELLRAPLEQIEQEINSERRSRREAFDELLSLYEELLGRIASAERHLRDRCRFDDEDRDGSYYTLRQVFLEKLQNCCVSKISEWEELERDLSFLAQEREQDVTELLDQLSSLKTELVSRRNQLPATVENLENLEAQINELKSLFENGQSLRGELRKLQFHKDENLKDEERQLLNTISPGESAITISQLRQRVSNDGDVWKLLKTLHKKGHLEITLRRRD
jgi:DNA repair exonuclease SbcCD ATPase subunit